MPRQKNKTNVVYFECSTMRALYDEMRDWQDTNQKGFLSVNIQQDNGNFCCIALINPMKYLAQQLQEPLTKTKLYEDEMARYERKALKSVGIGVVFTSDIIPPEKLSAIRLKLTKCTTAEGVRAVFAAEEEF